MTWMKNNYLKSIVRSGVRISNTVIKKQPDYLVLLVGTEDATTNTSRKIVDDLELPSKLWNRIVQTHHLA